MGLDETFIKSSEIIFRRFSDNLMKTNAHKCHMLVSTNNNVKIKIVNFDLTNSKRDKLLRIKFDHKPSFNDYISELCKKASKTKSCIIKNSIVYQYFKRQILMNEFFKSQFSYFPVV